MKEVELAFKSVAEGLRVFAKGLEILADQMSRMGGAKPTAPVKPGKATAPKKAPEAPPQKTAPKAAPAKAEKTAPVPQKTASAKTSLETVFGIIAQSPKGVSSAQISAQTGYNAKKVANVIYKLKKRDQIQTVQKGVYIKK